MSTATDTQQARMVARSANTESERHAGDDNAAYIAAFTKWREDRVSLTEDDFEVLGRRDREIADFARGMRDGTLLKHTTEDDLKAVPFAVWKDTCTLNRAITKWLRFRIQILERQLADLTARMADSEINRVNEAQASSGLVEATKAATSDLVERVQALEARPVLEHLGDWSTDVEYPQGKYVSYDGGTWLSQIMSKGVQPGTAPAIWTLAAGGHVKDLEAKLADLEHQLQARPGMKYRGVFVKGTPYGLGDSVTEDGNIWTCINADLATPGPPGRDHHTWQLSVKKGRDARDRGRPQ